MQPSEVRIVFKTRHIVPPYLNHIDRSLRLVVQLLEPGDVATLDYGRAVMCLIGGVAEEAIIGRPTLSGVAYSDSRLAAA